MLEQTLFVFQTVPSGQNTKETLLDLCFVACQQAFDDYARPRHLRGGISVGDHTISSQLYSLPGCAFRSTGWRRRRRRRTNFAEKGDLTSNLRVRNTMHFGRLSVESAALCFHTDVVVVMVLPPDCKHVAFVKPPHPGPPQQHKILYLLLADATALVATCLFLLSFHVSKRRAACKAASESGLSESPCGCCPCSRHHPCCCQPGGNPSTPHPGPKWGIWFLAISCNSKTF